MAENPNTAMMKRHENGEVSRLVSYEQLTDGNPSRERMLGRLEAFLQTGVVIDEDDLMRVTEEYGFGPEEYGALALISSTGVREGNLQEPGNVAHMGARLGCLSKLSLKYFELTGRQI